jgi:uncharacterized protein YndB with AHSA1/START domain
MATAGSSSGDEVTTEVGPDSVRASALVDASPEAVFDYLRRPANHPEISGDHTVQGATSGPDLLSLGDSFGMRMQRGTPYWMRSRVVEFEPNRQIAWSHFVGHRWRWEVEPAGEGKSRVTETFDMSTAHFPPALRVMGYPKAHARNVEASVANVVAHFKGEAGPG